VLNQQKQLLWFAVGISNLCSNPSATAGQINRLATLPKEAMNETQTTLVAVLINTLHSHFQCHTSQFPW